MATISEFTIPVDATLVDAAEKIQANDERAVLVVDGKKVIGMISQGDIVRALLRGVDIWSPLSNYVQHSFKYMTERDETKAFELIQKHNISIIPIVNESFELTDVVSLGELLPDMQLTPKL